MTLSPVSAVFNVKDYGAQGDGVTVDDNAFREALAAVSVAGGTLLIPAGTYRLTKQLQGPALGISGPGPTPTVAHTTPDTDSRFYQVNVQTITGSTGTFQWRDHALKGWNASNVSFTIGLPVAVGSAGASITFVAGTGPGEEDDPTEWYQRAHWYWRGGGSKSLPWKSIVLQGAGREVTILDFTFGASAGMGDGLVVHWNTGAQVAVGVRVADLQLRNLSSNNKCGLSSITAGGGAPIGFTATGSPTLPFDRYRVVIRTAGGRGVAEFNWTRGVGNDTSPNRRTVASSLPIPVPSDGVYELPGTGVTVTFPAATFAVGNEWTFEATNYGGSAILDVGGSHVELDRVYMVGWKCGVTIDAGIQVHLRDCVVNPGTLTDTNAQTIGVLLANANLYANRDGTNATNIISVENGHAFGRYGVLDFGGVVHRFAKLNQTGAPTPFYFSSIVACLVDQCYFESVPLCHFETDAVGRIDGLTIRNCYVSNGLKAPLLWNRSQLNNLVVEGLESIGSPDGTTAHPYGLPAAKNNAFIQAGGSLLQAIDLLNCAIGLTSPGKLTTDDPALRGRAEAAYGPWGRHGVNTITPEAALHVKRLDPTAPALIATVPGNPLSAGKFEIDAACTALTLSASPGATGGGAKGLVVQVVKATTDTSDRNRQVIALERVIPQKQAAVVIVTCLGMLNGGPQMSSWRYRASFENYMGGPNCHPIGPLVKEWEMLHLDANLGEPEVQVSAARNGFAVVVKNGTASAWARWTVIVEIYQTGDGG